VRGPLDYTVWCRRDERKKYRKSGGSIRAQPCRILSRLLRQETPTHLGIAFDRSLRTNFRNRLYPDYKANREEADPQLKAQLRRCETVARVLGATVYGHRRYEADDLIGTLTHQLSRAGHRVIIVSSDKDLAQLVTGDVQVLDFAKAERWTPSVVRKKFLVKPQQIPDLLGLAGDSVDNIPGVPGVGGKTAVSLLRQFGSMENLSRRLDRVRSLPVRGAEALQRKLEKGRELAFLSRRLALIATDAPIKGSLSGLRYCGIDRRRAGSYLRRLGFEGLRRRFLGE
jgi:5'-3' exonuclease